MSDASRELHNDLCGDAQERARERDLEGMVARLIFRLQDVTAVCRRWEPDYSSPEDNTSLFFANEAVKAAARLLKGRPYEQPGPVETGMDQARIAALWDGAPTRPPVTVSQVPGNTPKDPQP